VPVANQRVAVIAVPHSSAGVPVGRQGVQVGRVRHPGGLQHALAGGLPERLTGEIFDELLHNGIATAGIAEMETGEGIHPNGRGVGRRLAVQNLLEHGHGRTGRIAQEAIHGDAAGV